MRTGRRPEGRHSRAADETVLSFLRDVRSARSPERASQYLAPRVRAHQGSPGRAQEWVDRTPTEYAQHVLDMHEASGPWEFEVVSLARPDDMPEAVEATWLQKGTSHAAEPGQAQHVVEHGRARYVVLDGQIVEYWITAHTHFGACTPSTGACIR